MQSHYQSKTYPSRIPITAKSDKKKDIYIQCRICEKWVKCNHAVLMDEERFIRIICCGKVSMFPTRMLKEVLAHPGQKYIE